MDPVIGVITSTFGTYWWVWLLTAVIAYLIGSVNPAVIVTKIWTKGKKDIRDMGSGNAGFTNVLRSVGKVPAIITIVCDALKCVAAVLIGGLLFTLIAGDSAVAPQVINVGKYLAGIFCILGHSFPLYFHFKGGKGVVSAAALMLTEDWRVFLMILATFLILFLISKIISLGSIAGAVLYAAGTTDLDRLGGRGSLRPVYIHRHLPVRQACLRRQPAQHRLCGDLHRRCAYNRYLRYHQAQG